MAIPSAYYRLGAIAGTALLAGVALLTYWTKAVLVEASETTGGTSFAAVTEASVGKLAAAVRVQVVWLTEALVCGIVNGLMNDYRLRHSLPTKDGPVA